MKRLSLSLALFWIGAAAGAAPVLNAWTPIYKGIDFAQGTNSASVAGRQAVFAMRIDLADPDVRLFTTPALTNNYVSGSRETAAQKPAEFLEAYGLKAAVNVCHFSPSSYDMASGTACNVGGMLVSQGVVVSTQDTTEDALSTMLFTSNKTAFFIPYHYVPGTNTAGISHAVTGMYPVLMNGATVYGPGDIGANPHDAAEPRTAMGLSQDRRYLYLVVIDGRQGSYSTGASDFETGDWLMRCGAWDGMNCDGGGSSAMVMANTCGDALELNHNSAQVAVGRPGFERSVGGCFGVASRWIPTTFIYEPAVVPGKTIAALSWLTTEPATTQVEYGPSKGMGLFTTADTALRTNHSVVLSNVISGVSNYFRLISVAGGLSNSTPVCSFISLTNRPLAATNMAYASLLDFTNLWRFTSDDLDSIAWQASGYADSGWFGPARGGFYVDDNSGIPYRNTPLPTSCGTDGVPCLSGIPTTYYFRTHFTFPVTPQGVTLRLTNHVDDGAVYYLNGVEISRLHMAAAPAAILNATLSTGYSSSNNACTGDACIPEVIAVAGSLVDSNLRQGDNVMAVEVHNYKTGSTDAFFACAMAYSKSPPATTNRLLVFSSDPASAGIVVTVTPDAYQTSSGATPAEFYYVPGTAATVTAPPVTGSAAFARWEVDGVVFSTNLAMTLNMDGNRLVRAVYEVSAPRILTLASSSPTNGVPLSVSADLDGLADGVTQFQRSYPQGASITAVAPTNAGLNEFVKWTLDGADYSSNRSATVIVDGNRTLRAVYKPLTRWILTVAATNVAAGVAVGVAPADYSGLSDGVTWFQRAWSLGTSATLTAALDSGTNTFSKWQVDGVDATTSRTVVVDGSTNHLAVAFYRPQTRQLTITSINPITNSVRSNVTPADQNGRTGIENTPFTRQYPTGAQVNLAVSGTVGTTRFQKWMSNNVDVATLSSTSIFLNADTVMTAVFTNIPPPPTALSIRQLGSNVVLSWTNSSYTLQYATNLSTPVLWTNVPGAAKTSPYTNPASDPSRYFQLKW